MTPYNLQAYDNLLAKIMKEGVRTPTRAILPSTGKPVDALSLFGESIKIPLDHGFPATTRKKLFFKTMAVELLWFLKGSTNAHELQAQGCHIWDEWAREDGELGPVYGKQWRNWGGALGIGGIDQIKTIIEGLRRDPSGRRHCVSAWNVADLSQMALPPCHVFFQFRVLNNKLHCAMTQRSADHFLGSPFNIASYALLTHLVGKAIGCEPKELTIHYGDVHIYANHLEQVELYLSRLPMAAPTLELAEKTNIDDWKIEDIKLQNYQPHPSIAAEIAV